MLPPEQYHSKTSLIYESKYTESIYLFDRQVPQQSAGNLEPGTELVAAVSKSPHWHVPAHHAEKLWHQHLYVVA